MSNISGQLIKDSYNYVLQSDLISGIVYRIGGSVVENPKFISGLTVNANFTYSDGSEFPGYVLTCDAAGNAVWSPVSGATSGVVVTGGTFDYSAGTLTLVLSNGVNVPISGLEDIYVTGGTVSGTSIVFSYNDTNTFQVTGITPYSLFSSYTASTQSTINNKLDTSGFTAYTASTQSIINNKLDTSGFTAYTATTQPLILNAITGGTYSNGVLNLINNSGTTIPISGFTTGGTSTTDSYVTGFTLDNDTITLSQNRIDQYSAFNISLSGYVTNNIFSSYTASTQSTINNKLDISGFTAYTATTETTINNKLDISGFTAYTATTQPLILNSVTGGTFSGGTLYLINNSGTTIPISGFTTGGTSITDTFVTGFTLSANTITLSQNRTDSYSSFTISLSAYTGSSVSGAYLPLSGGTVTGPTIFQSGLTANTISATTYLNLPSATFTGGTVSGPTNFTSGLTANTISATTFSGNGSGLTNVQNIYNADGTISSDRYVNISGNTLWFSGLAKGFQVAIEDVSKGGFFFLSDELEGPSFSLLSSGVIQIEGPTGFYNQVNFDSTITINTLSPDNTTPYLLGLDGTNQVTAFDANYVYNSITGGTYSSGTLSLINNSGGTVSISGFSTGGSFTGGTVTGPTNFTSGLTANTISATTYQNLPATPFLPLSGGTVNGQLSVSNASAETALIVSSSNAGTTYGIYSIATQGVNAYGVYGVASAGESESITNGIGGYFAADNSNSQNPTNRYSVQLKDGTEGLNKVLTSVTSDGKANWETPKTNGSNLYLFYNY